MADQIRLVLHIGAGKCGSSAIQQFLVLNVAELRRRGILVPGRDLTADSAGCGQHLRFFEDGIKRDGFDSEIVAKLDDLRDAAREAGCHTVLISGENLINPKGFVDLFVPLKKRFDIRVVAYVRRQDDFAISAWQQWQIKRHRDFWEYYGRVQGKINWHRQLEPWRRRYGREAMTVRRFSSSALVNGDVVADFCQVIGVDGDGFARAGAVNRSLHERFNQVASRYRDELFDSLHDHRFYQFLEEVLGERAYKDYRGSALLTLSQRRMIVNDHAVANGKLRDEYFADLDEDEPLFPPPKPSDVHVLDEPPMDESTQLLYLGMFRMWSRLGGGAPVDPVIPAAAAPTPVSS